MILRQSAFLLSEDFAGTIGAWVEAGVVVYLERLGPPGHLPAKMAVNELLGPAIALRDLRKMHQAFSWAIAYMDHEHSGNRMVSCWKAGWAPEDSQPPHFMPI